MPYCIKDPKRDPNSENYPYRGSLRDLCCFVVSRDLPGLRALQGLGFSKLRALAFRVVGSWGSFRVLLRILELCFSVCGFSALGF